MAGFTDEWSAALKAQNDLQRQREQDSLFREQQGVDNEMKDLMSRTQREQARKQLDFNNVMSSAIKMSGNGALPEVLRGYINRRYGWDGQTTGVLAGSGYQKDGNYVFRLGNGADNQGNIATQNLAFSRPQIFQMAQVNRAAFTDDDRRNMRYALLGSGMTDREVSALEFSLPGDPDHIRNRQRSGAGGREIGSVTFKGRDTAPRGISTFSANGKGDFSRKSWRPDSGYEKDYDTREGKSGNWKWIRSDSEGKLWVNDKTGEERFVRNGESIDDPQASAPSVEAARIRAENALALEEMRNAAQTQMARQKTAVGLIKDFDEIADELGLKGENKEAFKARLLSALEGVGATAGASGNAPTSQGGGQQAFRELSQGEYRQLSGEEKAKYREAWKAWKKAQAK